MKQNFPGHSLITAFNILKSTLLEAPVLHYPDPSKHYTVYTDAWDDACGARFSQKHDGQEHQAASISHTFKDTPQKWSTREQEAYGIYYALTNWNYYLLGFNIVVHNEDKPLQKFLYG